jgi:hypothetical protein
VKGLNIFSIGTVDRLHILYSSIIQGTSDSTKYGRNWRECVERIKKNNLKCEPRGESLEALWSEGRVQFYNMHNTSQQMDY